MHGRDDRTESATACVVMSGDRAASTVGNLAMMKALVMSSLVIRQAGATQFEGGIVAEEEEEPVTPAVTAVNMAERPPMPLLGVIWNSRPREAVQQRESMCCPG